jgi:integrase
MNLLSTPPRAELIQGGTTAEDAFTWLRDTLGTVAPRDPVTRRLGTRRHRLDLLTELCERETFLLVTSWLGSEAVRAVQSKRDYADDIRMWAGVAWELGGHERFFLGCISPEMIETWTKAQKARNAKPRTINRRLSALTSFTSFAAWKLKDTSIVSPVSKYDRPYVDPNDEATATPILEKNEFEDVMRATETVQQAVTVALIYTLAGRVSECCKAQISALITVDGKKRLDLLRKRSKERGWPIPDTLWGLLEVAIDGRTEGAILLDDQGQPMDRHAVDRMLTRIGKRAGVLLGRDLTPHVLRASRLTHMHDEGAPLEEIQEYADHASILTTQRYVRMRQIGERRARHAQSAAQVYSDLITRFTDKATV